MPGAGISNGDELIVDRPLTPVDGSVVAILDGELTSKRLRITAAGVVLAAEHKARATRLKYKGPKKPKNPKST